MSENPLKWTCDTVDRELKSKGYNYLKTVARGSNIIIYTEENGEKVNRFRLTKIKADTFLLGMADSRSRWEPTPYEGSIKELISMIIEQFPWVLVKW